MRVGSSLLLATFLAAPLALQARPKIIINRDPQNITRITGTSFSFDSDKNGGGVFTFQNESGVTWTSLDFFVTLPIGETISCSPSPFFSLCEQSSKSNGNGTAVYDIGFDIVDSKEDPNGIPSGQIFSIDLNNGTIDCGDWGPNNPFDVSINGASIPEPASLLLFGGGCLIAGIAVSRRRKQRLEAAS